MFFWINIVILMIKYDNSSNSFCKLLKKSLKNLKINFIFTNQTQYSFLRPNRRLHNKNKEKTRSIGREINNQTWVKKSICFVKYKIDHICNLTLRNIKILTWHCYIRKRHVFQDKYEEKTRVSGGDMVIFTKKSW